MTSRFALLLLLPAAVLADVEMRYSDGTVGLVSDGRVMFGDDDNKVLFEPGADAMIVIDYRDRTWMRLEPGFVSDMAAQMKSQMDAMLAGMPPEQRAMVEAQMQGMMPQMQTEMPKMELRRTGASDEVAGYDCDEAEVRFDDGTVEELICIATAGELGIPSSDVDALISAMQGMAEMASLNPDSSPQADFSALGGLPIRSRSRDGSHASELVSLDTSSIDAARLRVPDGYREITMQDMMGR